MVLLLTLTQMLEQRPADAELAALADEMVTASPSGLV